MALMRDFKPHAKLDDAISALQSFLALAATLHDQKRLVEGEAEIGRLYSIQGDMAKAREFHLDSCFQT